MGTELRSISEMRAFALAKLLLTERTDLHVFEAPTGAGYDLLVRVQTDATTRVPEFAVEIKATRGTVAATELQNWIMKLQEPGSIVGLPWCLFLFHVDARTGQYCWLHEPRIDGDHVDIVAVRGAKRNGNERHLNGSSPALAPLDRDALDAIVERVVAWTKAGERAHPPHARAS